jgi:hypothetical protein
MFRYEIPISESSEVDNISWIVKDYLALNATGPFRISEGQSSVQIELESAEDSFLFELSAWSDKIQKINGAK